ncbi:hypothetical protein KI387_029710, partial [Taxus chinensis]
GYRASWPLHRRRFRNYRLRYRHRVCEADDTSTGTGTRSQFTGRGETGSHRT